MCLHLVVLRVVNFFFSVDWFIIKIFKRENNQDYRKLIITGIGE